MGQPVVEAQCAATASPGMTNPPAAHPHCELDAHASGSYHMEALIGAPVTAADDERLLRWTKLDQPIIASPPQGLQVLQF